MNILKQIQETNQGLKNFDERLKRLESSPVGPPGTSSTPPTRTSNSTTTFTVFIKGFHFDSADTYIEAEIAKHWGHVLGPDHGVWRSMCQESVLPA